MAYTIAAIWVFLSIAGIIGLLTGAFLGGRANSSQERTLRRRLDKAEAEARTHRAEAAKLAAAAEGATGAELIRLERSLETATARADQLEKDLESWRQRVHDLESGEEQRLTDRIAELETERVDLMETHAMDMESVRAELDDARNQAQSTEAALEELRRTANEQLSSERAALEEQRQADLKSLADEDAERTALRERIADLEESLAQHVDVAAERDAMAAKLAEMETQVASTDQRVEEARKEAVEGDLSGEAGDELARLRWRNRYLASRVDYLDKRLTRTAEAEGVDAPQADGSGESVATLQAQVSNLEAALRAAQAPRSEIRAEGQGEDGFTLEFRNRYLASRVRYLEQRIAGFEAAGAPYAVDEDDEAARGEGEVAHLRDELRSARAAAADVERLRVRLAELERERVTFEDAPMGGGDQGPSGDPEQDVDYTLEWKNRYLTSRVKYLEERLAEAGATLTDAALDDGADAR